jgi:acyl-CoA synthetase (NDP forming)
MSGGRMDVIETALREGRRVLSEHESKEVLRAHGITVTREREVHDEREFREALVEIGFPLVIKACGPKLSHKTEQGLVHVDIRTQQEAMAAFKELMRQVKEDSVSVLVQEKINGSRELMVGLTRDAQFGPCVMFGLGGIFTEILRDIAFRVAPIEKSEALDMMGEIKARRILEAFRGMPAADINQLADILIKVGAIGLDHAIIKEIDINPIILSGSRPVAVDALIVLNP